MINLLNIFLFVFVVSFFSISSLLIGGEVLSNQYSETSLHLKETTLCFVRHGETDWNKAGRIQGHHQVPLNEKGRIQAKSLCKQLSSYHFDVCYSSDLIRAGETADLLTELQNKEVMYDERLRERDVGQWVGADREAYQIYRQKDGKGIESDSEMRERIHHFIGEISQKHSECKILVVTHGGVIRNLVGELTGKNIEEIQVSNMAYLQIAVNEDGISILSQNGIQEKEIRPAIKNGSDL